MYFVQNSNLQNKSPHIPLQIKTDDRYPWSEQDVQPSVVIAAQKFHIIHLLFVHCRNELVREVWTVQQLVPHESFQLIPGFSATLYGHTSFKVKFLWCFEPEVSFCLMSDQTHWPEAFSELTLRCTAAAARILQEVPGPSALFTTHCQLSRWVERFVLQTATCQEKVPCCKSQSVSTWWTWNVALKSVAHPALYETGTCCWLHRQGE